MTLLALPGKPDFNKFLNQYCEWLSANEGFFAARLDWPEQFMFGALLSAGRSSCTHLQTGAVIEKDKRIIASGYNGAPPGIENCLKIGCRKDYMGIEFDDKGKSVCRGIHAEVNAMSQIAREDLKGTALYSLYFPCTSCAKQIVGSGIEKVLYSDMYVEPDSLTKELFSEAGIMLIKKQLTDEIVIQYLERTLSIYMRMKATRK